MTYHLTSHDQRVKDYAEATLAGYRMPWPVVVIKGVVYLPFAVTKAVIEAIKLATGGARIVAPKE